MGDYLAVSVESTGGSSMKQEIKLDNSKRTKCEVWSRVMGYHRPVKEWNIGKQQEHADRTHFKEPKLERTPSL